MDGVVGGWSGGWMEWWVDGVVGGWNGGWMGMDRYLVLSQTISNMKWVWSFINGTFFSSVLSNKMSLSIGPLMPPSSERMMRHTSNQSHVKYRPRCVLLLQSWNWLSGFLPPSTQGSGCFIMYIQQVVALHVSQVIRLITL